MQLLCGLRFAGMTGRSADTQNLIRLEARGFSIIPERDAEANHCSAFVGLSVKRNSAEANPVSA
jgi:hypothetical protein